MYIYILKKNNQYVGREPLSDKCQARLAAAIHSVYKTNLLSQRVLSSDLISIKPFYGYPYLILHVFHYWLAHMEGNIKIESF